MKRITALIFLSCFTLVLVSCNGTATTPSQKQEPTGTEAPVSTPSTNQMPTTESTPNSNINNELVEPVLLDTLKRNCQINRGSGNFNQTGLAVGETAVNFTLKDISGREFRLSQLLAEKPVLMIFGSFT